MGNRLVGSHGSLAPSQFCFRKELDGWMPHVSFYNTSSTGASLLDMDVQVDIPSHTRQHWSPSLRNLMRCGFYTCARLVHGNRVGYLWPRLGIWAKSVPLAGEDKAQFAQGCVSFRSLCACCEARVALLWLDAIDCANSDKGIL